MREVLGLTLFVLVFPVFAAPQAQNKYPRIQAEEGQSSVRQKGVELKGRRIGRTLRESVTIETSKNARVRIELGKDEALVVGPDSLVLLPAIDWETGRADEIEIKKGSVFLDLKGAHRVRSPLFYEQVGAGRYEFVMESDRPEFRALVFTGELSFRGLETEFRSRLEGGETQSFRGETEDGEILYDVLLEGRRVARGQLLEKIHLQPKEILERANAYLVREKKKVKETPQTASKEKARDRFCQKPKGAFNQCSWTCENNPKKAKECELSSPRVSCVRRRCLANGTWGDDFEYAPQDAPCSAKVEVRNCDY